MRMIPTRSVTIGKPLQVKQRISDMAHIIVPLKGLDLSAAKSTGKPLTGPILDNWVIAEDKVECRPGNKKLATLAAGRPIETIVPFYGFPSDMILASDEKLIRQDGTVVKDSFTSNDWSWTAFVNLGVQEYTLLANGTDGVWSWDGDAAVVKEAITFPTMTWFDQNRIHIVITHQNRVWFADRDNLTVYYLPIQTKSGDVKQLPLSAIFKRGGTVRAIYTWSIDGGAGMDDKLVIFSSHNECAIYAGTDPDTDFQLVGVYRFDSPMSKHCVEQYGGELYVLISTGLVPLSTMIRAETEQLGTSDKGVLSAFQPVAQKYRDRNGWSVILDHSTGRMICNMPLGAANRYKQMVRKMPTTFWTSWSALPSRCWQWIEDKLYIGTDSGELYEVSPVYLNDNGQPIRVDMQPAWSNFRTPAYKDFKLIRAYITTDGDPRPYIDVKVDYDTSPPTNQPDASFNTTGGEWDEATWDVDSWAGGDRVYANWQGVASAGNVGAPRLVAYINNCRFGISGFDVVFEHGSIMG